MIDDDFISDAPEAGERIVVTINEDNEIVEQESQQLEEEGVSVSIDPVSEFDIELLEYAMYSADTRISTQHALLFV